MAIFVSGQFALSLGTYSDRSMSFLDNIKRVHLIKSLTQDPDIIGLMDGNDISMILREPSLSRMEKTVTAWHFHGESCSLDIYFSDNKSNPDYIEYRPLTLNKDVLAQYESTKQNDLNHYCLKDVLDSRGVNTPENYARQPVPSWDNPYRT